MTEQDSINRTAAQAARQAVDKLSVQSTSIVHYRSQGRVLVIGGAAAWPTAGRLSDPLQATVVSESTRPDTTAEQVSGHQIARNRLSLSGHLGDFRLLASVDGQEPFELQADLVLDLGSSPLLGERIPPPGYLSPADNPQAINHAIAELTDLVGVFEKPTYFQYEPSLCAHSRNGITACTRCLDVCPTLAISSIGEQIAVDPNLCQGIGSCAGVCPSGAIRYAYPGLDDSLQALRVLLDSYRQAGGRQPRVLIHDAEQGKQWLDQAAPSLPSNIIGFQIEEAGSLGMEAWLNALAFGAADLTLLATPSVPESIHTAIAEQMQVSDALMDGMGYGRERIRLCRAADQTALIGAFSATPVHTDIPPATHAVSENKREMSFWALDHLYAHAPAQRPVITLPSGAPFGAAEVDAKACTLCLACVSACPGHALQDGYDKPELRFIESNCLQCSICTRTCPENAIWITPRFLFDSEARRKARLLHEEAPFECISCGKPFATRSVITNMLGKLSKHPMFQSERALRRLQMCEDCRVIDVVQDTQAMEDNLHRKHWQ